MPWLKRGPNKLERLLAAAQLDEALAQVEPAIAAGALIATRTGNVGHRKSALHPGARCEALSEWTGWRLASDEEGLKPCHRCGLAGQEKGGVMTIRRLDEAAPGVRFIPRLCSCTWTLRLGAGEATWTLTETGPLCRLHGISSDEESPS